MGVKHFEGRQTRVNRELKTARPATELLLPNLVTAGSRLRNASQNAFMAAAVRCTPIFFFRCYASTRLATQSTRVTSTVLASSIHPGRYCSHVRFCSIRSLQSIRRCTSSLILNSETGLLTATPVFSLSFVIDQQWRPFVPL